MTYPTGDLAPLLVPPPTEGVRFGQGVIEQWNPDTFENVVRWRGVALPNLPVLGGVEGLTFAPGDTVGLLGWAPGPGAGSWWILGRIVVPGSGAAEQAVAWMETSLGRAIAAEVFADRVYSDTVPNVGDLTGEPNFVDLADVGPSVSDVLVETGSAIVSLSCSITGSIPADTIGLTSGLMGFEVSGDTNIPPDASDSLLVRHLVNTSGGAARGQTIRSSYVVRVDGLTPGGIHTFTAKYSNQIPTSLQTSFTGRNITVIAL